MKFDKPKGGESVGGRYDDGTTEAQRANMRAIYEDQTAYAEWRIRMGLAKPPDIQPTVIMRHRVGALARQLSADMQAAAVKRPREPWIAPPARKLTLDELGGLYRKEAPRPLAPELRKQFTGVGQNSEVGE